MRKYIQFAALLIVNMLIVVVAFAWGVKVGVHPKARELDFANGAFPNTEYLRDSDLRNLYLDMVKCSLTDLFYEDNPIVRKGLRDGSQIPDRGYTMIGLKRLDNIQIAIRSVISDGVEGDFIECGAWRGGATIFMKAVLRADNITDRTVWVADSFEGLPVSSDSHDKGLNIDKKGILAVEVPVVKMNFQRYGLYDDRVKFLKGWFKDTLPGPIEKLAVLRVDGDLYESTMDALNALYDKVSPGGWVIIDDCSIPACKQAVEDFRRKRNITEPIVKIDWTGVYWIVGGKKKATP